MTTSAPHKTPHTRSLRSTRSATLRIVGGLRLNVVDVIAEDGDRLMMRWQDGRSPQHAISEDQAEALTRAIDRLRGPDKLIAHQAITPLAGMLADLLDTHRELSRRLDEARRLGRAPMLVVRLLDKRTPPAC